MVKKVITNLDSSKAFGPDCIPGVVLKNGEPELVLKESRVLEVLIGGSCI